MMGSIVMKELRVKEWPAHERPRERLLNNGASSLSDAELLAAFIGSGTRQCNSIALSRLLISTFGSLRNIIHAPRKEICQLPGFGNVRYITMQAVIEIVRRSLLETTKKNDALESPSTAREYLLLKMRDYQHEVFACLFLDNQHCLIAFEELFHGTINNATVHPREVIKRALHHNAAAIILAHNHPSGSSEPSSADKEITSELKKSLNLIDVRVLDHFVVGETIASFAEMQLL